MPLESVTEATERLPPGSVAYSGWTLLMTLATALILLLALEVRWPYYFLQDDSVDYYLPAYFYDWRSLLHGHLALYNFHIYTGIPHASLGQTAVFYVPQYLGMFLSETIWGNPFAAIGLIAFMHALIAVAGVYVLLRYLGTSPTVAAFGALSALSGFFVWCGRMWPVALMLCAWFPWMVWASLRYLEKPAVGRAGWLMFFRLGLLFGGQSQFFVLAMIFEHLFALSYSLAKRQGRWRSRCLGYLGLDLPTALLGLPLLLPMWAEVGRSLARSAPLSYAKFSELSVSPVWWVFGQLFVSTQLRLPKDYIAASLPYLSYVGYIVTFLSLGAGALWKNRPQYRSLIVAAGVCFFLSFLWFSNAIGPLIYHLPVLNRFRWPFKLIYFAGFSQSLVAALVLTLFSRRWQRIAIVAFLLNWIVVFCFLPNHAWRIRDYHPPLKSPWQDDLKDGRYLAISRTPITNVSTEFVQWSFSMLWGTDDLLGYEPLVPRLNGTLLLGRPPMYFETFGGNLMGPLDERLLRHLKVWSVKYALVGPRRSIAFQKLASAGFQPKAVRDGWTLWMDPDALPRVRWGGVGGSTSPGAGIHWVEHANSIDVDLTQWPGRKLVFAFMANHDLETCVAGHCLPVCRSADGLIRVDVPHGVRRVRLVYHNPLFLPSFLIALASLLVYLSLLFRHRRGIGGGGSLLSGAERESSESQKLTSCPRTSRG